MVILTELEQLIREVEAQIPANPNAPANERRAGQFGREMRRYFRALEDAFPYEAVKQIYYRYVKPE